MLERELTELGNAIRAAVTRRKNANETVTRRLVRTRRRDLSLMYREDPGFAHFPPQRIEEDVWDRNDREAFYESAVKTLDEFKVTLSALGPTSSRIENFSRGVAFASFDGLDDTELSERVRAAGREIAGQPLPVTVTAFLDGLAINESPFVVSDHLALRLPTPEDVAEYVSLDEFGGFRFHLDQAWFRVVGVFIYEAVSTGAAQVGFLRALEALRLFRVGGVETNRYVTTSRHFLSIGASSVISGPRRRSRFGYTLAPSDASVLGAFLRDIAPLFPDSVQLDKGTSEKEIAYARYKDALFQDGPSERAITSAVTALEALFLTQEPELTHRLAQRVSLFLRILGAQPDAATTYARVRKGYKIRSTFIHGGALAQKDRPEADSLAPILVEYARECVLAFFQTAVSKRDLLEMLDRAMIDPEGAKDVASSLACVVHR
jgi:hypothetical protein